MHNGHSRSGCSDSQIRDTLLGNAESEINFYVKLLCTDMQMQERCRGSQWYSYLLVRFI